MFERVVIASGDSNRQVKALADRVQERIKELGARVYGVEGEQAGEWVLVDLGDVVVHIMHPDGAQLLQPGRALGRQDVRTEGRAAKKKAARPERPRAKAARPRRSAIGCPTGPKRPAREYAAAHAEGL